LRIQTVSPLPELKVWYSTDHLTLSDSSVAHLKHAISLQLPALKQFRVHGPHLVLLLDAFELLDHSPLSVLRDGDLICVGILPSALPVLRKRKPCLDQDSPRMKKRQKLPLAFIPRRSVRVPDKLSKISHSNSDSSDDDSDSTDDDSNSTDDDSNSTDDDSTDDGMDSSSSSSLSVSAPLTPPTTLGIQQPSKPLPAAAGLKHAVEPVVPPGFGKLSTQSRNRRRRVKKKYEKEAARPLATSTPPTCISLTNSHPLGPQSKFQKDRDGPAANNSLGMNAEVGTSDAMTNMEMDAAAVVAPQGPFNEGMGEVMMSTLRNKNKKKGYKQSMAVPVPRKIVFADSTAPPPSQAQNDVTIETGNSVIMDAPARLVVPSERQDQGELPPRMFVTSVDVEESMWCQTKTSNKHKSWNALQEWPMQKSRPEGSAAYVEVVSRSVPSVFNEGSVETLDLDWDLVEKQWEMFEEINHFEQLKVGGCVGWKGLAIDTHTFTPEVLLTVARVTRLPDLVTGQQLAVRPFRRPAGSERASSSFGLRPRENEDEEHEWNSVISLKWRIINV